MKRSPVSEQPDSLNLSIYWLVLQVVREMGFEPVKGWSFQVSNREQNFLFSHVKELCIKPDIHFHLGEEGSKPLPISMEDVRGVDLESTLTLGRDTLGRSVRGRGQYDVVA